LANEQPRACRLYPKVREASSRTAIDLTKAIIDGAMFDMARPIGTIRAHNPPTSTKIALSSMTANPSYCRKPALPMV